MAVVYMGAFRQGLLGISILKIQVMFFFLLFLLNLRDVQCGNG